ncbi:MAG: hypothetical protein AB7R40_01295 [Nitrospiraceae bacterium]
MTPLNTVALPPGQRNVLVPPTMGVYAGLYSIGSLEEDYRDFSHKTGNHPPLVFTFHDWVSDAEWSSSQPHLRTFMDPMESSEVTPLQIAERIRQDGAILAIAWALQCCDWESRLYWLGLRKPTVTVPRLLRGEFDEYIVTVAHQIKAYGHPIMLTLFSEFNYQGMMSFGKNGASPLHDVQHLCKFYGDPSWPDGPERIRDAFIHVIEIFRREDVQNVTWFMYAGSHYMNPHHEDHSLWLHPRYFYPGDEYIDWVGQSAYFVDPRVKQKIRQTQLNTSLTEALAPGYDAWDSVTQRPLFLPEFGVLGDGTASRAAIIERVFTTMLPEFSRVKALTVAHFKIAEDLYEVPRLGKFQDETSAWEKAVRDNAYYLNATAMELRDK